jgi:CRP-like cAMP-binding protein
MTEVVCASCGARLGRTNATRLPRIICHREECATVSTRRPNEGRDSVILAMVREQKLTAVQVAEKVGISRQRVYQILNRLEKEHSDN